MDNLEKNRELGKVLERALGRTTNLGMLMNLGIPAVLFVLSMLFLSQGFSKKTADPSGFNLIFIILIVVSVTYLGAALFLKRRLLSPQNIFKNAPPEKTTTEMRFLQAAAVIYGLNLSPSLYGFVLIFLGGKIENFLLFAAFTLIGFQLARPRRGDVEKLNQHYSRNFLV